jgi:hypothetical protein
VKSGLGAPFGRARRPKPITRGVCLGLAWLSDVCVHICSSCCARTAIWAATASPVANVCRNPATLGLGTAEKYRNTGRKSVDVGGLRRTDDQCSEQRFQTSIRYEFYFASRGSQGVQRLYGVCANAAHSSRLPRSRGAVCGTVPGNDEAAGVLAMPEVATTSTMALKGTSSARRKWARPARDLEARSVGEHVHWHLPGGRGMSAAKLRYLE